MANPYRWLALGTVGLFGSALLVRPAELPKKEITSGSGTRLAPVYAAPAEVTRTDTLGRGETLSELLERSRLDAAQAALLLAEMESYRDPRSLQAGAVVNVRRSWETGAIREVELGLDRDRTVRLRREAEGWIGSVDEVPVRADTAVLVAEVRSSLYQALLDASGTDVPRGEREALVDVLAERVFAWKIDFARDVRPGDRCRLLVERMVRPDGTARTWRLLAVRVEVNGAEHEAFWFRLPDGSEDYFDREGESLRRAFLRAPLAFRRISSAYTTSRFHPILKRPRPHHGIDYAAGLGTPVRAVGDGRVAKAGWGGAYGNLVEIRHTRGYASRYAHLRGFADGVRPGTRVKQGDLIGYVGSTGLSTGPHLHYEFHSGGRPVDPNSIRYLTGDPVPGGQRSAFLRLARARIASMDAFEGSHLAAGSPPKTGDAGE